MEYPYGNHEIYQYIVENNNCILKGSGVSVVNGGGNVATVQTVMRNKGSQIRESVVE